MSTKSKVFEQFDLFRQTLSRHKRASIIAAVNVSLQCLLPLSVFAAPIGNSFGFDSPIAYVEAGLVLNGPLGDHNFPATPTVFLQEPPTGIIPPTWFYWDPNQVPDSPGPLPAPPPPRFTDSGPGIGVRFRGASAHTYAPHADEIVPAPKWNYDITYVEPSANGGWGPQGWWWSGEKRIRGSVPHPEGDHTDNYTAVVGVLRGTVPGPSLAPRRVIIGGTLGVHAGKSTAPPPRDPIFGGGELKPPSGLPSAGNQDLPMGQLLTIVNTEDIANSHLSMMAIVDGFHGSQINNVYLRHGQNGPILMDLLPMMQVQHLGQYDSVLRINEAPLPQHIVDIIASGNAHVSIGFPTSVHPDGAMVGAITLTQEESKLPGDYNNNNVVDAGDYNIWRTMLGQSGHGLAADGNGDNIVDHADRDVWRANFGRVLNSGSGSGSHPIAVPEPAGALLLVIGAVAGIWRRRRGLSSAGN
jgi:hypothetical protein